MELLPEPAALTPAGLPTFEEDEIETCRQSQVHVYRCVAAARHAWPQREPHLAAFTACAYLMLAARTTKPSRLRASPW
mgnify:CR=1 FL=1